MAFIDNFLNLPGEDPVAQELHREVTDIPHDEPVFRVRISARLRDGVTATEQPIAVAESKLPMLESLVAHYLAEYPILRFTDTARGGITRTSVVSADHIQSISVHVVREERNDEDERRQQFRALNEPAWDDAPDGASSDLPILTDWERIKRHQR